MENTTSLAAALKDISLVDSGSHHVRLGQYWSDQTACLIWVRHFGWLFCREQLAQLRDHAEKFQQANASLVAIGSGDASQAANIKTQLELPFPILSDPERVSYRAAGMRKDWSSTINVRTVGYMVRSFRNGFRQGKIQGDPFQQGGAMAVSPAGAVLYRFVSSAGGHHFDPQELLNSLDQVGQKANS